MRTDLGTAFSEDNVSCDSIYIEAEISAMHIRKKDEQGTFVDTYFYIRKNPKVRIDLDMSCLDYSLLRGVDDLLSTFPKGKNKTVSEPFLIMSRR